jgi:hypothetical protein
LDDHIPLIRSSVISRLFARLPIPHRCRLIAAAALPPHCRCHIGGASWLRWDFRFRIAVAACPAPGSDPNVSRCQSAVIFNESRSQSRWLMRWWSSNELIAMSDLRKSLMIRKAPHCVKRTKTFPHQPLKRTRVVPDEIGPTDPENGDQCEWRRRAKSGTRSSPKDRAEWISSWRP